MVSMRDIEYEADGRRMIGRLGLPDGDDVRPAVLICHEGPGLDDFQKDKAGTFAEAGYVAFALDYHGDGAMLPDRDAMMTSARRDRRRSRSGSSPRPRRARRPAA